MREKRDYGQSRERPRTHFQTRQPSCEMPKTLLHDTGRGTEVRRRVQALTPDMTPRWGKMSIDQMLHHVNFVLAEALGEHTAKPNIRGLPKPLVRWVILNLPWG